MLKGGKHSEETREKMSLSKKGKIPSNIELIKGYWKNRKFSIEHREKIGKNNVKFWLGKNRSEETKKKIGLANKGRILGPMTNEIKNKISQTLKGRMPKNINNIKGWNRGLETSEEVKRKISEMTKRGMSSQEVKERMKQNRLKQIFPHKDTSIEVKLQSWLKEQNIEFEKHYPILGQPDIFIKPNMAIFADGCYWHKCPECGFGELRQRDKEVTEGLQKQGYTVIRLWEHEINKNQFSGLNQLIT